MFNNLINIHDFTRVFEKIAEGRLGALLAKLPVGKNKRVRESWQHIQSPPTQWYNIPAVKERLNRLVSGDPQIDHRQYIATKYLAGKNRLTALSLGCGTGANEIAWVQRGLFSRFDACDISPTRITEAWRRAGETGLAGVLNFFVADAHRLSPKPGTYDLVIFEGSLHDLDEVSQVLSRVKTWLKPDGLLVVRDFAGPSRFQWSSRQLEVANGLLATFPPQFRTKWQSPTLKKHIHRPGRLRMRLSDPSEAVDSARIKAALETQYRVIETKNLGGTILQLLFADIAHHFCGDDPVAHRFLHHCFGMEDELIAMNDITSDFILALCGKGG